MTLGFVVGKFYPPHRGHKHLIDTARAQVDRLVVLLPHHPSQTIPGELRRDWLREIHPDCEIVLVPDKLGDDAQAWATFTVQLLGRSPDMVFTSEDYGPRFAAFLNCPHVMVDRDRTAVPISGSAVRADPLNHLDFLEPCVRAHYVKRVVIIGAESTGKTTLAEHLAKRFDTVWVPEYGREHWEKKIAGLPIDGPLPGWTPGEFVHIAAEQQRRENHAAREANKVLICDTNAFATGTWFERYYGCRSDAVDAIGQADKVDLYLLTAPDVPFVQDGVRDGEMIRDWMHARFVDLLARTGVNTVLLTGPFPARTQRAVEAIQALLDASTQSA